MPAEVLLLQQSSSGAYGSFGVSALSNSGQLLVVSKGGYLYGWIPPKNSVLTLSLCELCEIIT